MRKLIFLALLALAPATAGADESLSQYVNSLKQAGYADLAIDYLQMRLNSPGLSNEDRASIEFDIASAMIAASEELQDLSKREQMLEGARDRFQDFTKKYPKHPKQPDAMAEVATIELQKGRLRLVEAQLPSNEGRKLALAQEGRERLESAAKLYTQAYEEFKKAHAAMPVFIDPEQRGARELQQQKDALFAKLMDARFQTELSRFYVAESYEAIELPKPEDPKDKKAMDLYTKQKAEWDKKYKDAIETARKGFESIYKEFRRELVGLYGHLWMARCMAAQGDHRRAMGIFQQLMEHENRLLEPLQRQVFHFRLLSYMARKEYDQVFNFAPDWLQKNIRYQREPAYQGVQMELAKAYIAQADATGDQREKVRFYQEADRLLNRLGSYPNQYTGLARREQLRIANHLKGSGPSGRTFNQLFSLANAKLDTIKPDTPEAERQKIVIEAKQLFRDALNAVQPEESIDSVNDARVALAYTCLLANDVYEGALIAEYVARLYPTTTSAPQAASFAVTAYAMAFDQAMSLQDQGVPSFPDVDSKRLIDLADYMAVRWPDAKETASARMTVGRLEYFSRKNYAEAAAQFDKVQPRSPDYAEALALAGGAYWDLYKSLSGQEDANPEELQKLRANALDRLSKGSKALRASLPPNSVNQQLFLNDAMLAEVYYEAGDDKKALEILEPMVDKIRTDQLPNSINPQYRNALLTTALQVHVRLTQLDKAYELVDLIGKQQTSESAGGVTVVFVNLANRMREQLQRLRASGDDSKASQMANAFEGFLDLVAQREAGQDMFTRTILADNYLEIEKYAKAASLLQQIIDDPQANTPENRPRVLRAQMLLAKSKRMTRDFEAARQLIDQLYANNKQDLGIIMERGEILEASGDLPAAILHWKELIRRLMQIKPRPDVFYTAVDRLVEVFKQVPPDEKRKRLIEGLQLVKKLVVLDAGMSHDWKTKFEKHIKDMEQALEDMEQALGTASK